MSDAPKRPTPRHATPTEAIQSAIKGLENFRGFHNALFQYGPPRELPPAYWQNLQATKDALLDCKEGVQAIPNNYDLLAQWHSSMDDVNRIEGIAKQINQHLQ